MKRNPYPYNEENNQFYCKACKNIIPDLHLDIHVPRCPFCGYSFDPGQAQVKFIMKEEGKRL